MNKRKLLARVSVSLLLAATAAAAWAGPHREGGLSRIKHIVVIYQENWSFDSLYGQFPGANGLARGFDTLPQRDRTAVPPYSKYVYVTPQPLNNGAADDRFPPGNGEPALPAIPYDFTDYVPVNATTGDIVHRFYHHQLQIDNGALEPKTGANDKFDEVFGAAGDRRGAFSR